MPDQGVVLVAVIGMNRWWLLKRLCSHELQLHLALTSTAGTRRPSGLLHHHLLKDDQGQRLPLTPAGSSRTAACTSCWHHPQLPCTITGYERGQCCQHVGAVVVAAGAGLLAERGPKPHQEGLGRGDEDGPKPIPVLATIL